MHSLAAAEHAAHPTIQIAEAMAALLEQHPLVLEVQVFGAVARNGEGTRDVDLIVIAEKEHVLRAMYDEDSPVGLRDEHFQRLVHEINGLRCRCDLMFLWPYWQHDLAEVERRKLADAAPMFWFDVACDARPVSTKRLVLQ